MRRSKKQPDYDPNELADLIETPAVGRGVGSHLLIPQQDPNEVTTVVTLQEGSIVASVSTPVDTSETATIVPGRKSFSAPPPEEALSAATTEVNSNEASIDDLNLTTVDISEEASVDTCLEVTSEPTTVVTSTGDHGGARQSAAGVTSEPTTVVTSAAAVVGRLWISDSGEIVPASRVRLVTAAADALSSGEEALYNLLLRSPALRETAAARSVQAGYDSLTKGTGFSRKTIQRTIDRLIAKHYIEIETPADIYRRTSTVYRVFRAAAVMERLTRRECTRIAKIGPGVAFVTPLSSFTDRPDTVVTSNSATIATEILSTVDRS